jgi:alpha-beta hydrolase superfamily lysophospholipase
MVDAARRLDRPLKTYDEALSRFEELLRHDSDAVDPRSRSRLISPGHRTQRAIVFFHGLTNSPQQFACLAERFVARDYAVLIPRVPYHGYLDRMTTDQARLRASQLVQTAAEALDIGFGLADEVTVCGISMGGILTIWAAQHQPVRVAAPIAPAIGLRMLPYAVARLAFSALGRLPNRFVWWDPRVREALPGPAYAYPRFSTRALAETQRLAQSLMEAARQTPPCAGTVWMISNAADLAVSNTASALLTRRWQQAGATNVRAFQFPRRLKLFHDMVDPLQPNARTDLVHPILERIIADGEIPAQLLSKG